MSVDVTAIRMELFADPYPEVAGDSLPTVWAALGDLDELAQRVAGRRLSGFISPPVEALKLYDEELYEAFEPADSLGGLNGLPSEPLEQWFPAADGLTVIDALRDHLDELDLPSRKAVAEELADIRARLCAASGAGRAWRLGVQLEQ